LGADLGKTRDGFKDGKLALIYVYSLKSYRKNVCRSIARVIASTLLRRGIPRERPRSMQPDRPEGRGAMHGQDAPRAEAPAWNQIIEATFPSPSASERTQ
jgi:hypothetical protein